MNGINCIQIDNFRGIKHLEIDDFSRVNVFLGQNSSGKSTILECIILSMGMSNPDLPQTLNSIRARSYSSFSDLGYMFPNMDMKVKPRITVRMCDGTKRNLDLGMTYVFDEKSNTEGITNGQIPTSETKNFLNTMNMNFEVCYNQVKSNFECSFTVNQMGVVVNKKMAENYLEKTSAFFLSADLAAGNPTRDLVELAKRKKKDLVIEQLKKFDSRINAVEILNNVVYVGVDGIDQLLAINMMGDGIRRYLNIVVASANPINDIILIDEIDNGLHYSAYKKLWEAIFAFAMDSNKQVFITTHSKETLYRLNEMLEENVDYRQEFRLYTIANTLKRGHQAYKYTFEGLQGACENDVELRGMAL